MFADWRVGRRQPGMKFHTGPCKSFSTSRWVDQRCGISQDIGKQELASERPSRGGVFPQVAEWHCHLLCAGRRTLTACFLLCFFHGWTLKWRHTVNKKATWMFTRCFRTTNTFGLWACESPDSSSSCLNYGSLTSWTAWLDFDWNYWKFRVRVNKHREGERQRERERDEKTISRWDFEGLSVCQTAGFAQAAGEGTTAASEISFDNAALEIPPFGKRSRELVLRRNSLGRVRQKEDFSHFLPVTTRHPCRGSIRLW